MKTKVLQNVLILAANDFDWGKDQIRIELGTSTGWYILAQITGSCVNNETSASKMVFNGYLEWFL